MTSDAEHEMYGRMPVWRLFLKCSIPGMISGLVWAFCSIMDGIFVGNYLGSDALAAVNLAWPIMTVFMAVSDMVAAGSSVRISMHLGNGDTDMARRVFTGSVKLIVAISVGFLLIGVFLGGPIVTFMGAEGEVADMAAQYIAVFSLFAPVGLLFFATDNYLRICGAVNLSMWINVGVAVLNVALLAVLIGWLGCGTWASAFATSFSVALGSRRRFVLRFVGGWMDADTTRRVLYNGTSTFFNSVSGSLFGIVANAVLLSVAGNDGVAAYGIIMYVNTVVFSLFTGMAGDQLQPRIRGRPQGEVPVRGHVGGIGGHGSGRRGPLHPGERAAHETLPGRRERGRGGHGVRRTYCVRPDIPAVVGGGEREPDARCHGPARPRAVHRRNVPAAAADRVPDPHVLDGC